MSSEIAPLLETDNIREEAKEQENVRKTLLSNVLLFGLVCVAVLVIAGILVFEIVKNEHPKKQGLLGIVSGDPLTLNTVNGIVHGFEINVTLCPPNPGQIDPVSTVLAWRGIPFAEVETKFAEP